MSEPQEVTGYCAKCHRPSVFPWDAYEEAHLSVCCFRKPIDDAALADRAED